MDMDYRFSEEHEMLRAKVRKFAETKLAPIAPHVDELDEVSWEVARLLANEGLFTLLVPPEYGGIGIRSMRNCIVREELSRISVHADLLFAEMALCTFPISTYGTPAQKQKYLPPFARGETLGSFALTEPDAGSDVANLKTVARLDGDHYVLNGGKCFASVGPFAQTYVTFARTDPSATGSRGISAFIVEKGTPGFTGTSMKLMGPHPIGELSFVDCRVPKENLLGETGRGMRVALSTLDFLRMSVGASAIGIAQRAFEEAVSYSKKRIAFGQPIAELQSTQFKLADMAVQIEAARLLVYKAAWLRDEVQERVTRESAMAKLFATEMAWRVVDEALQLHGGYGVVRGMPVERLYRAVRQPRVYEGTSEIQRVVISRSVLE
jgi:alkylation response protein AidB-like acyl-CoA dehydrogenase